jgi:hypothetical protein
VSTPTNNNSARSRDPFERALHAYHQLPRAGRWGAIGVIALGGFFVLDSVLWPIADDMNRRADRMELVLKRASARSEGLPSDVEQSVLAHGPNTVPKAETSGKEKLAAAIAEVFKKKNINPGQDVRPAQPLPGSVMPDVASALGGTMGKTVAEVRFEGSPEAVLSVISDLDANPAIDAIGDLRLNYNPGTKRVGVQMTLEKWGVVKKTARGGA